jgi:hypothetical protein
VSADRLLSQLSGVRRTGSGRWVAKCPAHQGRRLSLSIRELDDGRVLLHDFAGCEVESVLSAVGLAVEDLFPPRPGGAHAAAAERRPFSVTELMAALAAELNIAWVLLGDVAAGREHTPADRKRAAVARDRCVALIEELRHVR